MTADIVSPPVISLKFSFLFPGADCSNLCISSLRCGIDWVPIANAAMSDIALSAANRKSNPGCEKSPSLIDELNDAVATGGDKERQRILERVADLFAAGARGYATDQIALFDDVLQPLGRHRGEGTGKACPPPGPYRARSTQAGPLARL
jgi:hypothetical protein